MPKAWLIDAGLSFRQRPLHPGQYRGCGTVAGTFLQLSSSVRHVGFTLRPEESVVDEAPPTNRADYEQSRYPGAGSGPQHDPESAPSPLIRSAPNGETRVTLSFRVRDNISGFVHGLR